MLIGGILLQTQYFILCRNLQNPCCRRLQAQANAAELLKPCLFKLRRGIGRLLGLQPCSYYNCAFRAINDSETQPPAMTACPVCLRKLHWNIGFDILSRYQRLIDFYSQHGSPFEGVLGWVQIRKNHLQTTHSVGPTSLKVCLSPRKSQGGAVGGQGAVMVPGADGCQHLGYLWQTTIF